MYNRQLSWFCYCCMVKIAFSVYTVGWRAVRCWCGYPSGVRCMVDCLHMIRPMRVPCQDPSSLALLKSRMVLPVRLPRFSAKEAIQWVFVYAYIIYIFQQTTMASIELLAQASTVCCGNLANCVAVPPRPSPCSQTWAILPGLLRSLSHIYGAVAVPL